MFLGALIITAVLLLVPRAGDAPAPEAEVKVKTWVCFVSPLSPGLDLCPAPRGPQCQEG